MTRMTVTQDLAGAWRRNIEAGKISNIFQDPDGRSIEFGLRLAGDGIEYYARDVLQRKPISAEVMQREVDGGQWLIQFNGFRALKPGSKIFSIGKQSDLPQDPDSCRFDCQNPGPLLSIQNRDPIAEFVWAGWHWCTYYNATPFEKEGHFLWLPAKISGPRLVIPHRLQILTEEFLEGALALYRNCTGLVVFFNSLHAGASVNHIHFQAVCHSRSLAIENVAQESWRNHRTLADTPLNGIVFDSEEEAKVIFPYIDALQKESAPIPYNLIFIGKQIYLIPRDAENEIVEEFPTGVLASMELAGKIITVDPKLYESANQQRINLALEKTVWPKTKMLTFFERRVPARKIGT